MQVSTNLSQRGPVLREIVLKVNILNIEVAIDTATRLNILNNYTAARKQNKAKPNAIKDQ